MLAEPDKIPSNDASWLVLTQNKLTYLIRIGQEAETLRQYADQLMQPWKDALRVKIDSMPDDQQKALAVKEPIIDEIKVCYAQIQSIINDESARKQSIVQANVGLSGARHEERKFQVLDE